MGQYENGINQKYETLDLEWEGVCAVSSVASGMCPGWGAEYGGPWPGGPSQVGCVSLKGLPQGWC